MGKYSSARGWWTSPNCKTRLVDLRIADQDLSVIVRGDGKTKYRQIRAVLDVCQQVNVAKVDLATEAADKPADKK